MTDEPRLRACPFCGGPAELFSNDRGTVIMCKACQLVVEEFPMASRLVEKWNRRAYT